MLSEIPKSIENFKYTKNVTKGLFFLILGVSSNFIGETLGCQVQQLLSENVWAKQLLTFMTINFGLDLTIDQEDLSLRQNLFITVIIYLFYLMFANMNFKFSAIGFILMTIIYQSNKYITRHKLIKGDEEKVKNLEKLRSRLIIGLIVCVVAGFTCYLLWQRTDQYIDDFDWVKFLFGTGHCSFNKPLRYDLSIYGRYGDYNIRDLFTNK